MNVVDFIEQFLFIHINQYGLGSKLGSSGKGILGVINNALTSIYVLRDPSLPKSFSWQTKRQAFLSMSKPLTLQLKYPILGVVGFYCSKMPRDDYFKKTPCDCPPNQCVCPVVDTPCQCNFDCELLDMRLVSSGKKLCAGEYQISGGMNNSGLRGQIVSLELPPKFCNGCATCESLYIEYYAGFNPVKCFTDKIMLPRPLYTALSFFMASDILGIYGVGKENEATNLYNKGKSILDSFNALDTNMTTIAGIDMRTQEYPGANTVVFTDNQGLPNNYVR